MLKRLRQFVADSFAIGHNEAKGVLVLILLVALFLLSPLLYRLLQAQYPDDSTAADQQKLDSLLAQMKVEGAAEDQVRYGNKPNRYGSRREEDRHTAERYQEMKPFAFNPNTISVADWQRLGLPRWMAERIDKYRSKGGQFRKKEDLLRIYDFPPEAYEQLEPYIQLPNTAPRLSNVPETPGTYPANPAAMGTLARVPTVEPTGNRYSKPAPPTEPFDINTADTLRLMGLKGIGSGIARRIIKERDGLGGFLSQEQFTTIYGLDSVNMAQLMKFAKVLSPVRKTPINTASAADLDRFPFLNRRQAEVIVNYRTQHGAYTTPESLKATRILTDQTIAQLTPYLVF